MTEGPPPPPPKEALVHTDVTGVILCATPGKDKALGMAAGIAEGPFSQADIMVLPAHRLEESVFNSFLTQVPELVSNAKLLQTVGNAASVADLEPIARGLLKQTGREGRLGHVLSGDILLVANDVILHTMAPDGTWMAHNKFKPMEDDTANRDEILAAWTKALTTEGIMEGLNRIKMRYLLGASAMSAATRKGCVGTIEMHFEVDPFSRDELVEFMALRSDKGLLATNFGVDWLNPIFAKHVATINGIPRTDTAFGKELTYLHHVLKGHLPEINSLLEQTRQFSRSRGARGNATGDVHRLMNLLVRDPETNGTMTMGEIFTRWGITEAGSWNIWRPKHPTRPIYANDPT